MRRGARLCTHAHTACDVCVGQQQAAVRRRLLRAARATHDGTRR
jgi:hypothetical protein